jgi:glutaredoxin-like protein NrdH
MNFDSRYDAIVYTKSNCPQCTATKRWLDGAGVDYAEVNLEEDEQSLAAVRSLGYQQAPVVAVDRDVHWSGFNPGLLELNFGSRRTPGVAVMDSSEMNPGAPSSGGAL